MDPSARSQFRAICYRQTSACIGHAVAKVSVMRLLGVLRLPLPQLISSSVLARNRPGPADSFSPSVPLTYASSLGSLPSPSSLSSSYAPSLWFPSVLRCSFFSSPLSGIGLRSHLVMNHCVHWMLRNWETSALLHGLNGVERLHQVQQCSHEVKT